MTNREFVKLIRAEFERELSAKTGWGRNEVLHVFDAAVLEVSLTILDYAVEAQDDPAK